jgi:hypothetical protein
MVGDSPGRERHEHAVSGNGDIRDRPRSHDAKYPDGSCPGIGSGAISILPDVLMLGSRCQAF